LQKRANRKIHRGLKPPGCDISVSPRLWKSHSAGTITTVATIILQLDPSRLSNPNTDIRYRLPDLLIARSGGLLSDDGYDYSKGDGAPCLLIFLESIEPVAAMPGIIKVLKSERVLGNDLSEIPVAVEDDESFRVVYPPNFIGTFRRPARG
jgi:hypothetical protein